MTPVPPPRWTSEEFEEQRIRAMELFRQQRLQEPLEQYLEAFDAYRTAMENLLEITVDLSRLKEEAVEVLTDLDMLEAVRYLAGPPISRDDLKVLAEASLAPGKLKGDPAMAKRVIETILLALDRNRFPWVSDDREPSDVEREAASMASAALLASQRVQTDRRNESKVEQENAVRVRLLAEGFTELEPRVINTHVGFPKPGHFCRETAFGERKADLAIGLWDNRAMPMECKVSNSSTNSVKRLNNDAAKKAVTWVREFGDRTIVPAAMLAGVFKRHNLEQAQHEGLTIFWAHDLEALAEFIKATKK